MQRIFGKIGFDGSRTHNSYGYELASDSLVDPICPSFHIQDDKKEKNQVAKFQKEKGTASMGLEPISTP